MQEYLKNNDIELSEMWNKPIFGINLQIDLGKKINSLITEIQNYIYGIEKNNVLLIPEISRHISVNPVIQWNENYKLGKEETWEKIKDNFIWDFLKLDKKIGSFEIVFDGLIITKAGIIFCGKNKNNELNNIRKLLKNALPFPIETKKENDLIHTTIIRYKNYLNNTQNLIDYINSSSLNISMKAENIYLRKELIWPSLKRSDIAKISLC